MRNIFRQFGVLFVFFVLWYVLLFMVSFLVFPSDAVLDNRHWDGDFFSPSCENITVGLWTQTYPSPKRILLMGASDVQLDTDLNVYREELPGFSLSNLGMGGTNPIQLQEIFDIYHWANPHTMKNTIFVLGISYGIFSDTVQRTRNVRWHGQDLSFVEAEASRYGLYHVREKYIRPMFNAHFMQLASNLLRPIFLERMFFSKITQIYEMFWRQLKKSGQTGLVIDPSNEEFRKYVLRSDFYWIGSESVFLEGDQLERFNHLCRDILQNGASLVLVDMPLPSWIRERSVLYKKYLGRKGVFLDSLLKMPHVQYLDMESRFPDSVFIDAHHLNDKWILRSSQLIAAFIKAHLHQLSS